MWLIGPRRPGDVVSRMNPDLVRQVRQGLSTHVRRLCAESQLPLRVGDTRQGHQCECDAAGENGAQNTRELHTPPSGGRGRNIAMAGRARMRDRERLVNFAVVKRLSRRESKHGRKCVGANNMPETRTAEACGAPLPVRVSGRTTEGLPEDVRATVYARCSVLQRLDRPT